MWVELTQDRVQRRALVLAVLNLRGSATTVSSDRKFE
jgi:hypothetical protein